MPNTIKKHAFKIQVGTAIAVLIFCITLTFKVTSTYNQLESSVDNIKKETMLYSAKYEDIDERVDENELNFVKIDTKLIGIESILVEIKDRLK